MMLMLVYIPFCVYMTGTFVWPFCPFSDLANSQGTQRGGGGGGGEAAKSVVLKNYPWIQCSLDIFFSSSLLLAGGQGERERERERVCVALCCKSFSLLSCFSHPASAHINKHVCITSMADRRKIGRSLNYKYIFMVKDGLHIKCLERSGRRGVGRSKQRRLCMSSLLARGSERWGNAAAQW